MAPDAEVASEARGASSGLCCRGRRGTRHRQVRAPRCPRVRAQAGRGKASPGGAALGLARPAALGGIPERPGSLSARHRAAPRSLPLGLAGSAWGRRAARSALPPGPAAARPPRQLLRGVNGRPAALLPSALWSRERGDTAVLQRDRWRERAGNAPAAFAARSPVRGGRGSRPAVARCSRVSVSSGHTTIPSLKVLRSLSSLDVRVFLTVP